MRNFCICHILNGSVVTGTSLKTKEAKMVENAALPGSVAR